MKKHKVIIADTQTELITVVIEGETDPDTAGEKVLELFIDSPETLHNQPGILSVNQEMHPSPITQVEETHQLDD